MGEEDSALYVPAEGVIHFETRGDGWLIGKWPYPAETLEQD